MVNDYERQDFWRIKIKIKKCDNQKAWYHDKIGQVFELNSSSVRDYYVKENGNLKCVLVKDAEILD